MMCTNGLKKINLILFHLASLVSVKDANKNYLKAKNINFIGTKHIIDAIIKFNPKLKWFFLHLLLMFTKFLEK